MQARVHQASIIETKCNKWAITTIIILIMIILEIMYIWLMQIRWAKDSPNQMLIRSPLSSPLIINRKIHIKADRSPSIRMLFWLQILVIILLRSKRFFPQLKLHRWVQATIIIEWQAIQSPSLHRQIITLLSHTITI